MPTYSASEISTGFDTVTAIVVGKFVLKVIVALFPLDVLVGNLSGVLPTFLYDSLYYLIAYPLESAYEFSSITYADFMSLLLLHFVGTSYDPTNPFCYIMFFVLPLYQLLDLTYYFLKYKLSTFITDVQSASDL